MQVEYRLDGDDYFLRFQLQDTALAAAAAGLERVLESRVCMLLHALSRSIPVLNVELQHPI